MYEFRHLKEHQMQVSNIYNQQLKNRQKQPTFTSLSEGFLKMQENLSYTRFVQDTATNWVPKAVFTRSKADLAEMSFLEFIESALFYFAPGFIGEFVSKRLIFSKVAKNLISKNDTPANEIVRLQLERGLSKNSTELLDNNALAKTIPSLLDIVPKKTIEKNGVKTLVTPERYLGLEKHIKSLLENKEAVKQAEEILSNAEIPKKLLPVKTALVLSCVAIPAAEYALSFAKNLFTLKVFKKADFNNIANLNKDQKEDENQQKRVEKSAKDHIKKAALISGTAIAASAVFAVFGPKSKALQKVSESILHPGVKISKNLEKLGVKSSNGIHDFLKTYINFDFNSTKAGKLSLSKGQLATTVIAGVFGYHAAAKDRGKLDELEMLTRVPLVAFYTIFGSSLFEKGFKHLFLKAGIFPDLIKKSGKKFKDIPSLDNLPKLAQEVAKTSAGKESAEVALKRLKKEAAVVSAIPFAFSMVFMGFLLSAINRFWTQYRYDHRLDGKNAVKTEHKTNVFKPQPSVVFKSFIKQR